MSRPKISPRLAIAVWERDGHRCFYCGRCLKIEDICFDHFRPVASLGGTTDYDNLRLSCATCNSAKGVRDGDEFRSEMGHG